jgi:hypothetical protein
MPRDHYISQVHLKNFYSPLLGNRMYAMRKSNLESFATTSDHVCFAREGSTNFYLREERAVEGFLKTIEPKYNASIAKLVDDKVDHDCINTIAGFIAYVMACSPTGVRNFSESLKRVVETDVTILEKRGVLPQPPPELGETRLTELLRAGEVQIPVDPKCPQANGIAAISNLVSVFGNFKWDILLNPFNDSPFFTSDFPVAIEQTEDWRVLNRIVPLAPNLAVRMRPNLSIDWNAPDFSPFGKFGYTRKKLGREELADINRLIVRCAEDMIFYRDDYAWVPKFITRNRHYRMDTITLRLPRGRSYLHLSSQKIVATRQDA